MKLYRWIAVLRVCLELLGGGLLLSLAAFWALPGAWLGLGVGAAIQAKQAGVHADLGALSPADLAAIALAVATIVLGAVAFFISIAAFFGYTEIKSLAEKTASAIAAAAVRDLINFRLEASLKIEQSVRDAEQRMESFRTSFAEDNMEARGLDSGLAADTFARAASGVDSSPDV